MAGVKISALPAAAAAALTDTLPAVQAGVTVKETLQQILTLFNGNIQIAESQVTGLLTDLAARLQLAGGTMTGNLILNGDPVTALGAATKQYTDSVAEGLKFQASCVAATTANLAGYVYNNGTAGVGATLTAGGNGAFSTDGVSPALNSRILVAFQSTQTQNGIYTLTQVGDGSNPAILTRATDYDTPSEIDVGDAVLVESGTLYTGTLWFQTATVVTIGVSNIVFSLTNSAANINAGTGLTKSGNTISVANNGITYSLMQQVSAHRLLGNTTAGATNVTEIATSTFLQAPAIQVFTANGTYTPTAGMVYCIVELIGGGGGGGGCASGITSCAAGGGGGGGGYARRLLTAAQIGASQAVTIGAGGAGGAAGANNGSNGGTTSLGALLSATGGLGGNGCAAQAGLFSAGGGNGGDGSGGDFNLHGQEGGYTWMYQPSGVLTTSSGGNGYFGGGAAAVFNTGGDSSQVYGGGGGGASSINNAAGNAAGGAGKQGVMIITEYLAT